ncbi:L,D-transpeptidase [Thalassococcus sp. BH17M4-6]|uniref:L,D-transpeptidase n=1 Tax=Thalassococcus sp. BH17M4-6 TaxID=3413148 RepID=UPI003BCD60B8
MQNTRRNFIAAGAAFLGTAPFAAQAASPRSKVRLPRKFRPQDVKIKTNLPVGTIYVNKQDHFLYLITGDGEARRYGVALGAVGRNFEGTAVIARKAEWPSWIPTRNMIEMEPEVYGPFASGLPGGHPENPLGARALYMYVNGRDTYYRIHGTHLPHTIGMKFSSGCIRLTNEHVSELYDMVPVGTKVIVA